MEDEEFIKRLRRAANISNCSPEDLIRMAIDRGCKKRGLEVVRIKAKMPLSLISAAEGLSASGSKALKKMLLEYLVEEGL